MIAALYVDETGVYSGRPDVDAWGESRDARRYDGPNPVVAHPPCQLWVNLAAVNWKRYGRTLPAWYPGGTDYGCFGAALSAIAQFGGVLEHPAYSHAWKHFGLRRPARGGWLFDLPRALWVCEVSQSAYGHRARKRTWLAYRSLLGVAPSEMLWGDEPGSHQVGWFDRAKPTLGKAAASATPPQFAEALIGLARLAQGEAVA